jgi:hypothetical protein
MLPLVNNQSNNLGFDAGGLNWLVQIMNFISGRIIK